MECLVERDPRDPSSGKIPTLLAINNSAICTASLSDNARARALINYIIRGSGRDTRDRTDLIRRRRIPKIITILINRSNSRISRCGDNHRPYGRRCVISIKPSLDGFLEFWARSCNRDTRMWMRDNEQLCNLHDKLSPSAPRRAAPHRTDLRAYPYRLLSDIALVAVVSSL